MALESVVSLKSSINGQVEMVAVSFTNLSKREVVIVLMESFFNGLYQLLDKKKGESLQPLSFVVM